MTIDVVGRAYKVSRSSFKPGPIPAASRLGHATQSDTKAAFNPLDRLAFAAVPKTSEAPPAPASLKTSRRGVVMRPRRSQRLCTTEDWRAHCNRARVLA